MNRKVLFLCPHHAAKSVIAAEYFSQIARQRSLPLEGVSAGTEPDAEITPQVVALLREDGIDVAGQKPRRVTDTDFAGAVHVVSMGCDIDKRAGEGLSVEHWDDIPPVSEDGPTAARAIRQHVEDLIARLS